MMNKPNQYLRDLLFALKFLSFEQQVIDESLQVLPKRWLIDFGGESIVENRRFILILIIRELVSYTINLELLDDNKALKELGSLVYCMGELSEFEQYEVFQDIPEDSWQVASCWLLLNELASKFLEQVDVKPVGEVMCIDGLFKEYATLLD